MGNKSGSNLWVIAAAVMTFAGSALAASSTSAPAAQKPAAAAPVSKSAASLLADIASQLDNVDKMVAAKKLDMVHNHAELIENACKDLATIEAPADTAKQAKITGYLHTMEKIAVKLDEYGDAGNAESVTAEVKKARALFPLLEKQFQKSASAKPAEAGYYTCPMHSQVHQATQGKCPICGMDLVYKSTSNSDEGSSDKMDKMKM